MCTARTRPCTCLCTRTVYTQLRTRPAPYIRHVHGCVHRPTRPVQGRVTAVYTCTRAVYTAITPPCTRGVHGPKRPKTAVCTAVHGPYTAVYMFVYMGRLHGRVHGPSCIRHVHGRVHARPVMYPARTWPFTRADTASTGPCNGRVHVYTGRVHDRCTACMRRVHGRCTEVRAEYAAKNGRVHGQVHGRITAMYAAVNAARHGRVHCPYSASRPFTRPVRGDVHGRVHVYTCTRAVNHNECMYFPWVLPLHGRVYGRVRAVCTARVHGRPFPVADPPSGGFVAFGRSQRTTSHLPQPGSI